MSTRASVPVGRGPAGTLGPGRRDLTSFVGRERELERLHHLVADREPLVTVVGPPGIGKTRVAIQLSRQLAPESALVCDLRGIDTASGLVTTVAEHLDGHLEAGQDPGDMVHAVGERLAAQDRTIVVLDNFEQLVPVGIEPLLTWLRTTKDCTFVVTSRRILRTQCEIVFELPPLRCSARGSQSSNAQVSEAAQLLIERVQASEPRFEPCATEDIEALVRTLQGMPLAIELAARRMNHLQPRELRQELERGPTLTLRSEQHDIDPRHRTLRGAIESSWTALAPFERAALSQLTVFRNGFDLEAARHVIDLGDFPAAPPPEYVLQTLREASLVHRTSERSAPLRWDMYEAIREYASGFPTRNAEQRHTQHYLALGRAAGEQLGTDSDAEGFAALQREVGNLNVAFERLRENEPGNRLVELAQVLYAAHRRSKPGLAIAPLTAALDASDHVDDLTRATLYQARGVCSRSVGDLSRAEADFLAARALTAGNPHQLASLDVDEGLLCFCRGKIGEARRRFRSAAEAAERHGATALETHARIGLAHVLNEAFQDEGGLAEARRAIELAVSAGDARSEARARWAAAEFEVLAQIGHPEEELHSLCERAARSGDSEVYALSLQALGIFHLDREEHEKSRDCLEQAHDAARRSGHRRYQACASRWLFALDEVERKTANLDQRKCETADVLRSAGDRRLYSLALLELSAATARAGRIKAGRRLLEQGSELASAFGDEAITAFSAIQEARIELVEAGEATDAEEPGRAKTLRKQADLRMDAVGSTQIRYVESDARGPTVLERSPETRWAERLFVVERAELVDAKETLHVSPDGRGFRLGKNAYVGLPKGNVIRGAMLAIANAHATHPAHAVSQDDIARECWPDERMSETARSERVRQVVSRLRRAGLQSVLRRGEAGYYLDARVRVVIEEPAPIHS